MSDLEKLAQIIQKILGNDNTVRKECEKVIQQVRESNADQYFVLLLQLLRGKLESWLYPNFSGQLHLKHRLEVSER